MKILLYLLIANGIFAALYFLDMPEPHLRSRTEMQIHEFVKYLEFYKMDHGRYPSSEEGLGELCNKHYMSYIPSDPWKNQYVYHDIKSGFEITGFEIISYGADGKQGGTGENADIRFRVNRSPKKRSKN